MADPVEELKRVIREKQAIIVCGAGTTIAATFDPVTKKAAPGWLDLIKIAFEQAKSETRAGPAEPWVTSCNAYLASANASDWLRAADDIVEKLGEKGWANFLRTHVGSIRAKNHAVPVAVAGLGIAVATTNYDSILARAISADPATWQDANHVAETLDDRANGIWHIHGYWDKPASVVFSKADYDRISKDDVAQFLQKHAAFGRTLIFVGCSTDGLADSNVGEMLKWFGDKWLHSGKQHYVLVKEGDQARPWPKGVTPVIHGDGFDSLAPFLASLTPSESALPPDPQMLGRADRLDELVMLLLGGTKPILIPGGPGMGKSTLALAAAHHPDVRTRWPKRHFVDLEGVTDARGIAAAAAQSLRLNPAGSADDLIGRIAADAAARPALVILDNAETPLRHDKGGATQIYAAIGRIDGLVCLVTCRDEPPVLHVGKQVGDIERLEDDAAREMFLRVKANAKFRADASLDPLIAALDGHPLSIEIIAGVADGYPSLDAVLGDWSKRRGKLFKTGGKLTRLQSTRVSVDLSFNSPECSDEARRLASLVALLPGGIARLDLDAIMPGAGDEAARGLVRMKLASWRDDRLHMLAPLREALAEDHPAEGADRDHLLDHYLAFAAQGGEIGRTEWGAVRDKVLAEIANFDPITNVALDSGRSAESYHSALMGISEINRFTGTGGLLALERAASVGDWGDQVQANCIKVLGDIALARSSHDGARARYENALPLYRQLEMCLARRTASKASETSRFAAPITTTHEPTTRRHSSFIGTFAT